VAVEVELQQLDLTTQVHPLPVAVVQEELQLHFILLQNLVQPQPILLVPLVPVVPLLVLLVVLEETQHLTRLQLEPQH
jgi:hypothetical protein